MTADDGEAGDHFEQAIDDALEALPDAFRERLGSVAIVVEDEASPDQLATVRARGLFGLYQGVPRTSWGAEGAPIASKITIFRGPLERAYREPGALGRAIRDTLYHEIAHHFWISDARLHELASGRR